MDRMFSITAKKKRAPAPSGSPSFFDKVRRELEQDEDSKKSKALVAPKRRRVITPYGESNHAPRLVQNVPRNFLDAPEEQKKKKLSAAQLAKVRAREAATTSPEEAEAAAQQYRLMMPLLSGEQRGAVRAANKLGNVVITGSAGTGKSFALKAIVYEQRSRKRNVAVTAATGVAAVQIGGRTLNSWAGIGLGEGRPEELLKKARQKRENWILSDVLVIDEMSMISSAMLETLDMIGRRIRSEPNKPFGGLQIVGCGDWFQLPPVGQQVDFCFNSPVWKATFAPENVLQLRERFRQSGDPKFFEILQRIRDGTVTDADINLLNQNCHRPLHESDGIIATKLLSTNKEVDSINSHFLAQLRSVAVTFVSVDRVKYSPGQKHKQNEAALFNNMGVAEQVTLKPGAQVMLTWNVDVEKGLCNGSRGVVKGFCEVAPRDLHPVAREWFTRNARVPIVRFANGLELPVAPILQEAATRDVQWVGRAQVPLSLAWAVTVHRSQGLSLDRAQLDLSRTFAEGQAYVALSRVRMMAGLHLIKPLQRSNIRTSKVVQDFYSK